MKNIESVISHQRLVTEWLKLLEYLHLRTEISEILLNGY